MSTETRDPWDRRDGESDAAWQAFVLYRDQGAGNRSIRRVATDLSKPQSVLSRWSGENEWRRRVEAWDREQDAIRRQAMAEELERIVKRQSTTLGAAAQALLVPINAYLQRIQLLRTTVGEGQMFEDYDLRELAREAREAARLVPQLIQAERLVHGLSTSGNGQIVEDQSEQERRRVESLTRGELEAMLTGV